MRVCECMRGQFRAQCKVWESVVYESVRESVLVYECMRVVYDSVGALDESV